MKNNKGITIIEMIVSIALISVVIVFLLGLLLQLKDLDDKSLQKLEYEERIAVIVNSVQERIKDHPSCTFNKSSDNLEIECSEEFGQPVSLEIISKNVGTKLTFEIKDNIYSENTEIFTFPNGSKMEENLDLDITGDISIAQYKIIDDFGHSNILEFSYIRK